MFAVRTWNCQAGMPDFLIEKVIFKKQNKFLLLTFAQHYMAKPSGNCAWLKTDTWDLQILHTFYLNIVYIIYDVTDTWTYLEHVN